MPNPWVNIARGFTRGTQAYLEKTVGERRRREEEDRQRSQRWADVRESRQYQREQTEEDRKYRRSEKVEARNWSKLIDGIDKFDRILEKEQTRIENEQQGLREVGRRPLSDFGTDEKLVNLVKQNEANPSVETVREIDIRTAQLRAKKTVADDMVDWFDANDKHIGMVHKKEVESEVKAANETWEMLYSYVPKSEPDSDSYQQELMAILSDKGAGFANIHDFEIALEKAERIKNRLNKQYYAESTDTPKSIRNNVKAINDKVNYILNVAGGHGDPIKKEDFIHKVKIKDQIAIEWAMLVVDPIKSKMALQELRNLGIDLNEKDVKNLSKWIK